MRDYRGEFEVHLTVATSGERAIAPFRGWCAAHQLKCVQIVLARGAHTEQPMATWRRNVTTLPAVLREAEQFATAAESAGLAPVRLKIEAAPHNDEIPRTDAAAAAHAAENYFEHHVKLLRRTARATESLLALCAVHRAHLSRNAFRQPVAGCEERFVTLRDYRVGSATSQANLARLLAALSACREEILEHESEYCVYDSQIQLDAGWLSADEPTASVKA